jgi:type I restriction enzyme M protein
MVAETNFRKTLDQRSADLFLILMIHLIKIKGVLMYCLMVQLTGDGVIKQRVRQKLLRRCNLHTIIRLP